MICTRTSPCLMQVGMLIAGSTQKRSVIGTGVDVNAGVPMVEGVHVVDTGAAMSVAVSTTGNTEVDGVSVGEGLGVDVGDAVVAAGVTVCARIVGSAVAPSVTSTTLLGVGVPAKEVGVWG